MAKSVEISASAGDVGRTLADLHNKTYRDRGTVLAIALKPLPPCRPVLTR